MRITLIHALPVSIAPIEEAFERLWPEANTVNLADDSLAGDLAAAGTLQPEMTDRFLALARYSAMSGADAILFTCSAFGPCIEACQEELASLPVLKPNEALIERCTEVGSIGKVFRKFLSDLFKTGSNLAINITHFLSLQYILTLSFGLS